MNFKEIKNMGEQTYRRLSDGKEFVLVKKDKWHVVLRAKDGGIRYAARLNFDRHFQRVERKVS
jgi:hypothetical protein